jgi:hypothetical protein
LKSACFQKIDALIDHNSLYPRANRRLAAKRIHLHEYIRKGVLQEIFGVIRLSDHAQSGVVHRFRVESIQFKLRRSRPQLARLDQFEVVLRRVQNTGVLFFGFPFQFVDINDRAVLGRLHLRGEISIFF